MIWPWPRRRTSPAIVKVNGGNTPPGRGRGGQGNGKGGGPPAVVTFVQAKHAQGNVGSGGTQQVVLDAPTQIGNIVVIGTGAGAANRQVTGITDNNGDAYTQINSVLIVGNDVVQLWYRVQTAASQTLTVQTDPDFTAQFISCVAEFSGIRTSNPVGVTQQASGNSNSPSVSNPGPTPGNLIVAMVEHRTATTTNAGTGYQLAVAGTQIGGLIYKLSATGNETAPFSLGGSVTWVEKMAEFLK